MSRFNPPEKQAVHVVTNMLAEFHYLADIRSRQQLDDEQEKQYFKLLDVLQGIL